MSCFCGQSAVFIDPNEGAVEHGVENHDVTMLLCIEFETLQSLQRGCNVRIATCRWACDGEPCRVQHEQQHYPDSDKDNLMPDSDKDNLMQTLPAHLLPHFFMGVVMLEMQTQWSPFATHVSR